MADKSINPEDPNFDAGFAMLHHSLADKFSGIFDENGEDDGDEGDDISDEDAEALEHYIPDDIQNDARPRDERP